MSANERRAEIMRIMVARRQENMQVLAAELVLRIELSEMTFLCLQLSILLKLLEVTEAVSVSLTGIIHIKNIFFTGSDFGFGTVDGQGG